MSYRLYVQPLTFKTESKPMDGELLVDIEDGNLMIYEEVTNTIHSTTADLHAEKDALSELISYLIQLTTNIYNQATTVRSSYDKTIYEEALFSTELAQTLDGLMGLENSLVDKDETNKVATNQIMDLINILSTASSDISSLNLNHIKEGERNNDELTRLVQVVGDYKTKLDAIVPEVKAYHKQVSDLVDTRQDRDEYNDWVTNHVNQVKAIDSRMQFRHVQG